MADQSNPVADPRAVVVSSCGKARFTVLTPQLLRMEWAATGRFEDRASQPFINRRLEVPHFTTERRGATLLITTEFLRLSFTSDGKPFHEGNLSVALGVDDAVVAWNPASAPTANLGGTVRTLDMVNGACPVDRGLLSRDGWALVDDSQTLVFDAPPPAPQGRTAVQWPWLEPRQPDSGLDWYFFGYGHDYARALRDYTKVAGKIPLPPKYVFGAWWSRYWAYSDTELKDLVGQFRAHDVPLDVLVIDMDWHLDGWTGYTWHPEYFPDPAGFLSWAREQGLRTTLNLHPADGVGPHEAAFTRMCGAMGLDPAVTERVTFDCTDPVFVRAYFELLHHPIEAQGLDFWWMDWQQGTKTNKAGLDPLWWLNHLHWKDMAERQAEPRESASGRGGSRPLIFSRWGGLGNHRYPIGFSGDTFSTWESLEFQPWFTSTAGNVGYSYWSHDIGGHQPGPVTGELYTRWVQFAVLSPVLRTHTSKNPLGERRIWAFDDRCFRAMRDAFHLRYKLLPYIYTSARRCYDDAVPLCRPLYHLWPDWPEAYHHAGQYMFGEDLLVAPVTTPSDTTSNGAAVNIWLPPGAWTNWYTGQTYEGPADLSLLIPLDQIPLFARGGAIIPTGPKVNSTSQPTDGHVTFLVWPGAEQGCAMLYEDDGISAGYEHARCAWSGLSSRETPGLLRLRLEPTSGSFDGQHEQRPIEARFVDRWPARSVRVDGQDLPHANANAREGWFYDDAKLTIVVRLAPRSIRAATTIEVTLDQSDERPLREGMHGTLKHLEAIGALLGDAAPALLRDAASGTLRAQLIASRGEGPMQSVLDRFEHGSLAREVARCNADPAAKAEALCRLIGLTASIDVRSHPSQPGVLIVSAQAKQVGEGALLGADGELTIQVPGGWQLVDGSAAARGDVHNTPLRAEASYRAPLPLQSALLRADMQIRSAHDEPVSVGFSRSVLPSINGWWVVGPFLCPYEKAMATPFAPEQNPAAPDTGATFAASAAADAPRLSWQRLDRSIPPASDPDAEFFVDLHAAFNSRHDDAVAYALTYIDSQRETDAVLAIGSDDGVAVWLNGTEVHRHNVQRGFGSRQDRVPVRLRSGRNTLLLKITQAMGGWGFAAHIEDRDGRPIDGVRIVR